MNKTKIEWTDYTFNPITGCLRGCLWCYAERLYKRFGRSFMPQFHPKRLNEPLKISTPLLIFLCSVADFFASWTEEIWRQEVYKIIEKCPQHIFQVLTQDPQNIIRADLPSNLWVGTTVRNQKETKRISDLRNAQSSVKFVSFEPILEEINADLKKIQWIIIGAMTGPLRNKYKPEKRWIEKLIKQAEAEDIPVFIKNNINWKEKIQEFPKY